MDTLAAAEEETWTGIVTVGHHRNSHIMRLLPLGLLLPAAIGEPGSKTPLTDPNMFGTFIPPANRGPITLGIFTAGVNPAFFEYVSHRERENDCFTDLTFFTDHMRHSSDLALL